MREFDGIKGWVALSDRIISEADMPFVNRELSWLRFNERVLEEACERENPPLERLKFLAITASNLDEFFMVRVAGLREQCRQGVKKRRPYGPSPQKQLKLIGAEVRRFMARQYTCLLRSILPALRKHGITVKKYAECSGGERRLLDTYYSRMVYPVLTPLAVDTSRPFPSLVNRSVNIAVRLHAGGSSEFALVQVPPVLPRLIPTAPGDGSFILIEDLICRHLDRLFPGRKIRSSALVRITRNGDLSIDEGAEDLMQEISKSIKKRKRGRPVRLELVRGCDDKTREFLRRRLGIKEQDIYELPGPLDLSGMMALATLPNRADLRLEPILPAEPTNLLGCRDLFEAIREHDRLVHHPYESFTCVTEFLRRAAEDPDVLAVKQTLYRVSGDSPIVRALERAAGNGKQVTVLVELKARFDEENNIHWARRLEQAGCHVIYGVEGLKTHCKILLVVRREGDTIRRYLHLGTGNYNDSTARLYTDLGLFTCREDYGEDAALLFNALTGSSGRITYRKFITAPDGMRRFFEEKIANEIRNAHSGRKSGITLKVNALSDAGIVRLLYEASCAGVPVRLIVRGICTLIPGVPEYSENIQVVSIVGQLLEHSRIYRFENGGDPQLYLGSADLMPRNLDRRVELIFPAEEEPVKKRLEAILALALADNVNARVMQPDGGYVLRCPDGEKKVNSQRLLSEIAHRQAKKHHNCTGCPDGRPIRNEED
ncbi:MAG TPA: polyphosphate kinase 1 [Candidatus Onthovicinus excrementipullorum]|nr:polyphosphate kinase 1 [Candidatus Onthovicinus excrementipullorum]